MSSLLQLVSILWPGSSAQKWIEGSHLLSSTAFNQIIIQSGSIYACQLCPQFVYNRNWSWNEKFIKQRMHLEGACVLLCVCVRMYCIFICVHTDLKVDEQKEIAWVCWSMLLTDSSVCVCVFAKEILVCLSDRLSKLFPAAVSTSCLDLTWCQCSRAECGQPMPKRLQFLVWFCRLSAPSGPGLDTNDSPLSLMPPVLAHSTQERARPAPLASSHWTDAKSYHGWT